MTIELDTDARTTDLKTARENSGLTLRELYERTRISVVNLEAIENGAFHLLPVPLYARNFIKTYAEALGVDSGPLLARYENYIREMPEKKKALPEKPQPRPLAEIVGRHKALLWIGGIFIVFIVASFLVSVAYKPTAGPSGQTDVQRHSTQPLTVDQSAAQPNGLSEGDRQDNIAAADQADATRKQPEETAARQAAESEAAPPQAQKTDTPAATPADTGGNEQFFLSIDAVEETWIRIQSDDKEPLEVLLKPGDKISSKAARFSMDIGNAGGIRISLNGKMIENLGKSGQVIHLHLP